MKATLKRTQTGDQNTEMLQTSIQAALDQLGSYTPKAPTNWISPAPSTLWDALDRLASLAKTLNGGSPIP